MDEATIWRVKLAAWSHDPAEKALVLMRDPAGHEGGTVRRLRERLFGAAGVPARLAAVVRHADHWAAAADRPQFPQDAERRFPAWAQVRFADSPKLVHPLSGAWAESAPLKEVSAAQIKAVSLDHFSGLLDRLGAEAEARQQALALWRFGPQTPAPDLGALWGLLPADTRIPDHSIWSHLDLCSAFATAFTADPEQRPALLAMSFGPVQSFIAQGRTSSDLWAGSHLLSCIAWEGMQVIAEQFGPDAILMPQLRGVPLVDRWLAGDRGLPESLFNDAGCEWRRGGTDHNPLFAAALPNRFVALVPAARVRELAAAITARVRAWVVDEARAMLGMVFDALVEEQPRDDNAHCWRQIEAQLAGFPEVHWSSAAWPVAPGAGARDAETALARTLGSFYPDGAARPGLLGDAVWRILTRNIEIEGARFFDSNPGALYPALLDAAERAGAAERVLRPFAQLVQGGYRDSISGEREWLCINPDELDLRPGQRRDTLWARLAERKPAWVRKGEHLDALAMLKRLWSSRFVARLEAQGVTGLNRYVVSTHAMALAPSLARLVAAPANDGAAKARRDLLEKIGRRPLDPVALPRKIALQLPGCDEDTRNLVRRLPALLDALREREALAAGASAERAQVEKLVHQASGYRPEAYYALLLMDGDHMGAWLAGAGERYRLPFEDTWRSEIRAGIRKFRERSPALDDYLRSPRPASPARHAAISEALNGFALHLAPHIVENLCMGKLLYAGGDDVMAMVAIDDLPRALWLLRYAYSGASPAEARDRPLFNHDLSMNKGFVHCRGRLYRVMGEQATASVGAVIAHHTMPLAYVLNALRAAERAAKDAGRNRLRLRILKRSGGEVSFTAPWYLGKGRVEAADYTPLGLLTELTRALAGPEFARRAAYLAGELIRGLPVLDRGPRLESLLAATLGAQFVRQRGSPSLARDLAMLAVRLNQDRAPPAGQLDPIFVWLRDFISAAEFLAREGRTGSRDSRA